MGNINSVDDPYGYGYGYNGYGGAYSGYNNEVSLYCCHVNHIIHLLIQLERYYRRYYPQYNGYYTQQQYAQPSYYNSYQQQQQLYPNMTAGYASTPYAAAYGSYGMPTTYGYNTPVYSSMYNSAPVYGQAYNNGYYPTNYLQRTYL